MNKSDHKYFLGTPDKNLIRVSTSHKKISIIKKHRKSISHTDYLGQNMIQSMKNAKIKRYLQTPLSKVRQKQLDTIEKMHPYLI